MKVFFLHPPRRSPFDLVDEHFPTPALLLFPVIEDFCFASCVYVYNKAINQGLGLVLSRIRTRKKVGGRRNYLLTSA